MPNSIIRPLNYTQKMFFDSVKSEPYIHIELLEIIRF